MGFYDDGVEMGLVEYGPGDVVRQMDEVNTFLTTVNKDVETDVRNTGNASFLKRWKLDVWTPWQGFYADFKSVAAASPSRFRDSTYKRAEAYRQLGIRFRENLEKKSNSTVTPVKVPDPIRNPRPGDLPGVDLPPKELRRGFPWRYVLIGGGALAVGYGVYRYLRPTPRLLPTPTPQENEGHGQP
jgi:hypothetical protein